MFNLILSQLKVKLQQFMKWPRKPQTHDYTQDKWGSTYVFEAIEEGELGYMTGQGQQVKLGDYILLSDGHSSCSYQVKKIDYYCNQPDMWIALLQKVLT
jgi:hypothetical protein